MVIHMSVILSSEVGCDDPLKNGEPSIKGQEVPFAAPDEYYIWR